MKGNFDKIINSDYPVLVDFYATWCGPCKSMIPIIKDVAQEVKGKVRIIKIDIDKNASLARRFNVRSIPTLAFFKNGKLIWQQAGLLTKHQIIKKIQ